jgi:hypothetical protein
VYRRRVNGLTEVSGQAGGDGVGGPFAVADVAVREGVQAKRLVPARELFVAAFGPVDGVDPLLELFGPVSYCGEGDGCTPRQKKCGGEGELVVSCFSLSLALSPLCRKRLTWI